MPALLLHSGRLDPRYRKLGFMIANEDRDQARWVFFAHICEYLMHAIWRLVKILSSFVDRFRLSFDFVAEGPTGDVTDDCAGMAMSRGCFARRYFDIPHKHAEMIAIHRWKLMRIRRLRCAGGGARRVLCPQFNGNRYKQRRHYSQQTHYGSLLMSVCHKSLGEKLDCPQW
jgi:hypothetical protein